MSELISMWIQISAIILGPIFAVVIGIFINSYKEKRQQKLDLFYNLVSVRNVNPPPMSFVNSLNMIDVIFYGKGKVINSWKKFYECLMAPEFNEENFNNRKLDLLYEMAKELGFKNIRQTELKEFYIPKAYVQRHQLELELIDEFLRVLKNSKSFSETPGTSL